MTYRFDRLFVSSFLLLGACYEKIEDDPNVNVCVFTTAVNAQNVLRVRVQSYQGPGDHRGAYLRCTITVSGLDAHIETVFKDGKDPNDLLGPPLSNSCEAAVEPGTYTLDYAGEEHLLEVPGGEHVCFGIDFSTEGPGGTDF